MKLGEVMDRIIDVENVTWRREGQEILKNIHWSVNKGEQWAILGLNGSGKTSILNIITGYNYPTKGRVNVLGTEFGKASLPEMRKKIGYVSNALDKFSSTLNKETVENIVLSGKFSSFGIYQEILDEDKKRAEEIITRLRLNHLKGKLYRVFSQGEKRRALIGRAMMAEPELLILDEPCSGLDVLAREDVLDITQQINQMNCHMLYVTHHIEEITDVVTHVLLVKDGSIIAGGAKEEVLTSELLSETYKISVNVHWENNRPWMSIN